MLKIMQNYKFTGTRCFKYVFDYIGNYYMDTKSLGLVLKGIFQINNKIWKKLKKF